MNSEGSNQKASNVPNRDTNKGKTSMSIRDKKVDMILLCFECTGHGHYVVVVCQSNALHFLC